MNKPELLSPAGNFDSLKAALAAGADAVYFGHSSFSNRARAKNFDNEQIKEAVKLCASVGAKVNAAVNIRIREHEMDDALRLCDLLLSMNVTENQHIVSLIVADLGLAAEIKRRFPEAVLHASTQTSLSSLADCRELVRLGFSRLVLPRELSAEEIARISAANVIETEIFIHGAHCVSLSGQCLLSYVMGRRSGNRGDCAQPCRLCYGVTRDDGLAVAKNPGKTPLSLADMCLAGDLAEVLALGVSSLKIEGRLKNPEYVYGVTRIYRRLIDEGRNAVGEEKRELAELFSRGFTDGYFKHRYYGMSAAPQQKSGGESGMKVGSESGKKTGSDVREKSGVNPNYAALIGERQKDFAARKRIPVKALFIMKENSPAVLEMAVKGENLQNYSSSVSVRVAGPVPAPADGRGAGFDYAARSLVKLGSTAFALDLSDLECRIDENLWLPTSALNDMRRSAAVLLDGELNKQKSGMDGGGISAGRREYLPYVSRKSLREVEIVPRLTAEFYSVLQWSKADKSRLGELLAAFEAVYVPLSDYRRAREKTGFPLSVSLPVLTADDEILTSRLLEVRELLCGSGVGVNGIDGGSREICGSGKSGVGLSGKACGSGDEFHVLVHTPGQAALVRAVFGDLAKIDVSFRANVTNNPAAEYYRSLPGVASVYGSPELPGAADGQMGLSAIVYGRLPLMHLSRCILSDRPCRFKNFGGRCYEKSTFFHNCSGYLTDRRGERFPVISGEDCVNFVFNSTPIWMGDRQDSLAGCPDAMFIFTDETVDEALAAVDDYKKEKIREGKRL